MSKLDTDMTAKRFFSAGKSKRTERRAPALLSEFATSLTSAPLLESTSGLAVRPAVISATGDNASHSNSKSVNRLAELTRMNEFEEENMTRLVMTKREAKRREEDEAALMMGFGVGGEARSRSRRQGGFEAELEGVLGERGGKSMWDSVGRGALGRREGLLERSRKRGTEDGGLDEGGQRKKGKFQKQVKRNKRR
jgi:U3 small nucleolar ribonucleoprotein protein LCP5